MPSNSASISFSGSVNATQNAIDEPSELNASSLVELLMQVKT
jgi:hypothetical protein